MRVHEKVRAYIDDHHLKQISVAKAANIPNVTFNAMLNGKRTMYADDLSAIRHKLIRPYTPRHNGKVERSHREDQKRFYDSHSFYSLADFGGQLAAHQNRCNNLPMRPLHWLSPREFLRSYTVQHV